MATKNKNGRPSNKDIQYIKDHIHDDPVEIARAIGKTLPVVKKWIFKFRVNTDTPPERYELERAVYDIQNRPFWAEIQRQFNKEECDLFIYYWSTILEQFKNDVLPTEELQIVDLAKIEILLSRTLTQENQTLQMLNQLDATLEQEKSKEPVDQDLNLIRDLYHQIGIANQSRMELNKNYQNLLTKKKDLLREIKGSREQRVEKLENSKITLVGWLKQLISDKELRLNLGMEMEKMRLATYKEYLRLAEYHTYEDGVVDQPFLCAETVEMIKHMVNDMEKKDDVQKV